MEFQALFLILISYLAVETVNGYGTANFAINPPAEENACTKRYPSAHGEMPQAGASPYELTVSENTYSPGSTITLTLTSKAGMSDMFKGYIVQALKVDDETVKLGEFQTVPKSRQNCPNFGGRTLTHNGPGDKDILIFNWTASYTDSGDFRFVYTVVKEKVIFWMNLTTDIITFIPSTASLPDIPTTVPTPAPTTTPPVSQNPLPEVDLSECGISKSCYREPEDCQTNCAYLVTWRRNGNDSVDFEVEGTMEGSNQYIAIGLSTDQKMGQDSVTDCIYTGQAAQPVEIQMSFNRFQGAMLVNEVLTDKYLGVVESSRQGFFTNGKLLCRFTRMVSVQDSTSGEKDRVFDLNVEHFLFVAKGLVGAGGVKNYHGPTKVISPSRIMFTDDPINTGGSASFPLIKVHAILMILAWMVSASFAVLMPRYCKPAWPTRTCGGKQIWYQIHMPLMICTLLLTVAGFIVIFVYVEGYAMYEDLPAKAHPILGIITTALVIINPLMAACRPNPGAPKRPIFNGFHFTVGLLAHVCAIATIFIAMYMPKANPPSWGKWVMVAFICWHALIEACLAIHMHCCLKTTASTKYEMTDVGSKAPIAEAKPDPGSGAKTFLVILHLLGVLAMALALIIPISQA